MILNGLKILDFTSLLAGPLTTMVFADLGADVLHVESEKRIDIMRIMPPYDANNESVVHQYLNRSKRSLALDLKTKEAQQIIYKLLAQYDIVVESARPGLMKRFELDYDTLKSINPRLIYCSITGYGQTGPYANHFGHDNNFLAVAGVLDYSRPKQKKPLAHPVQMADIAGTLYAATSILAAVIHREKTGEGRSIDISLTDSAFTLNAIYAAQYFATEQLPQPEEGVLNGGTYYDYYETKDGRYFSVSSLEPHFRKQLCEALEIPELIDSTFNASPYTQSRFKEAVCDAFKSRTFEQWLRVFNEQFDGCVEPVLTLEEACAHPQLQHRHMVADVPTAEGTSQRQIASPIKIEGFEPAYRFVGVPLGTHSEAVLQELLYSAEQIKDLQTRGILR